MNSKRTDELAVKMLFPTMLIAGGVIAMIGVSVYTDQKALNQAAEWARACIGMGIGLMFAALTFVTIGDAKPTDNKQIPH